MKFAARRDTMLFKDGSGTERKATHRSATGLKPSIQPIAQPSIPLAITQDPATLTGSALAAHQHATVSTSAGLLRP